MLQTELQAEVRSSARFSKGHSKGSGHRFYHCCLADGGVAVLDACASWFNLAAWILERRGRMPELTRLVYLNQSWTELP